MKLGISTSVLQATKKKEKLGARVFKIYQALERRDFFSGMRSGVSNWRNQTLTYKITIGEWGPVSRRPFSRDIIDGPRKSRPERQKERVREEVRSRGWEGGGLNKKGAV